MPADAPQSSSMHQDSAVGGLSAHETRRGERGTSRRAGGSTGNTAEHELEGPQPHLSYMSLGDGSWVIVRHLMNYPNGLKMQVWQGESKGWGGYCAAFFKSFESVASARAYANERGWE